MRPPNPTDTLRIFDTTLRDGEQAPGFSMDAREKLELARALARLRVDVVEAGFPASSAEDARAVRTIAEDVGALDGAPAIAGLARATAGDIDCAFEALQAARRPRIHVFLATSDVHLRHKLGISRAKALAVAVRGVEHARTLVQDVEFSAEDGARTDPAFLAEVAQAVCEAGASTFNLPDTVGYTTPTELSARIHALRAAAPALAQAVLSVHCHDDLGLAVANSLAAVEAGARQVECTLNGIGERAGNAALEEVVMAVRTRADHFGVSVGVDPAELYPCSRLLTHLTGVAPPPNKAVVGANAFAHEAGIHQHGVLNERSTYEIMRPEDVGLESNRIVLGKHSGKHALVANLERLGLGFEPGELERLFARFKRLAERKRTVFDEDLVALVADQARDEERRLRLDYLHVVSGTTVLPSATVRLRLGDETFEGSARGDGPVEAALRAVGDAAGLHARLASYSTRAATPGADALCEVTLGVSHDERTVTGKATATDTVEASARAYVDALDRLGWRPEALAEVALSTAGGAL